MKMIIIAFNYHTIYTHTHSLALSLTCITYAHTHTYSMMAQLNRVKAVEKEKGDLEGAKNEAEHYLSLQREMASKQHTLYRRYM